jgi:hypothetical protein
MDNHIHVIIHCLFGLSSLLLPEAPFLYNTTKFCSKVQYHIVIYNQMSSTIRPLIDNLYKSLSIVFSITDKNHPTNNRWLDHGTCPYSHDLSSFPTSWFYFKTIPVYRLYLRKSNWAYLFLGQKLAIWLGPNPSQTCPLCGSSLHWENRRS